MREEKRKRGEEEVLEDSRKEDIVGTPSNNDTDLVSSDDDEANSEMLRALDKQENNRAVMNTTWRDNIHGEDCKYPDQKVE